jgi:hypothetical protein
MDKFKIGDHVYSHVLGPDSSGQVINVEANENGQQLIDIKLDKPIVNIHGYSKLFTKI